MSDLSTPNTKDEVYMSVASGNLGSDVPLPEPRTRAQEYLKAIAERIGEESADLTELGEKVLENSADVDGIKEDLVELNEAVFTNRINVFNKDDKDIVNGMYIGIDGQWVYEQSPTFSESGYIRCKEGDVIRYCHWRDGTRYVMARMKIAFFDTNKNFISGCNVADAIAPQNGYFRQAFYNGMGSTTLITINTDLPNDYVPYGKNSLLENKVDKSSIKQTIGQSITDVMSQKAITDVLNDTLSNHWQGKKWYAYGTSLTSIAQGKYANYVAQFSNMELSNKGIPGGALVVNRSNYNALNDLTDGKVDADLITIEVGANDWSAPLGDISSMDINTFCGALNHSLQTILMNCPKAQVVLMCSTRQRTSDDGSTLSPLDSKNSYNVTYEQKNEAIRKVAVANGIYYIPFGSGLGLGLFRMQSSNLYNVDRIHHTELGGYNLAQGVWSYLKNIPLWYNELPSE